MTNMIEMKNNINSLALFLVSLMLTVGAFLTFPLYDDGWLALMLRESGPGTVVQKMGDRPVMAFFLAKLMSVGSLHKMEFVLLNAALWLVLAVEAKMLFVELFPEFPNYSIVAACATLAPIVVQTQLSTVMVSIPANLASILSYAMVLVLLKAYRRNKPNRLVLLGSAVALAISAVMLSEYGVAANLVGLIILLGTALTPSTGMSRHYKLGAAACLLAVTIAAYFVFTKLADFSGRPDVSPVYMAHHTIFQWTEVPFDVVAGGWHSWIAAYAIELGKITIGWDSKSTIVGVLFGLVIAGLLSIGTQNPADVSEKERPYSLAGRLAFLSLGLLIGLLPFKAMSRPTTLLEYGSRFRIPILPLAAVLTVALALSLVRAKVRWVPVAVLGLIIGYTSWTFTYEAVKNHRLIGQYGHALAPYVLRTAGNTVAIVPVDRFESELTATVTVGWPLELERKFWVVGETPAVLMFGNRNECREDAVLEVHMRGLSRSGKIDKLLWIEAHPGRPTLIEPYCRSSNSSSVSPRL
jgi:hypothetical protein